MFFTAHVTFAAMAEEKRERFKDGSLHVERITLPFVKILSCSFHNGAFVLGMMGQQGCDINKFCFKMLLPEGNAYGLDSDRIASNTLNSYNISVSSFPDGLLDTNLNGCELDIGISKTGSDRFYGGVAFTPSCQPFFFKCSQIGTVELELGTMKYLMLIMDRDDPAHFQRHAEIYAETKDAVLCFKENELDVLWQIKTDAMERFG